MTDRTWQMVAVAALGVFVVGGVLPVWPDAARQPDQRHGGMGIGGS